MKYLVIFSLPILLIIVALIALLNTMLALYLTVGFGILMLLTLACVPGCWIVSEIWGREALPKWIQRIGDWIVGKT